MKTFKLNWKAIKEQHTGGSIECTVYNCAGSGSKTKDAMTCQKCRNHFRSEVTDAVKSALEKCASEEREKDFRLKSRSVAGALARKKLSSKMINKDGKNSLVETFMAEGYAPAQAKKIVNQGLDVLWVIENVSSQVRRDYRILGYNNLLEQVSHELKGMKVERSIIVDAITAILEQEFENICYLHQVVTTENAWSSTDKIVSAELTKPGLSFLKNGYGRIFLFAVANVQKLARKSPSSFEKKSAEIQLAELRSKNEAKASVTVQSTNGNLGKVKVDKDAKREEIRNRARVPLYRKRNGARFPVSGIPVYGEEEARILDRSCVVVFTDDKGNPLKAKQFRRNGTDWRLTNLETDVVFSPPVQSASQDLGNGTSDIVFAGERLVILFPNGVKPFKAKVILSANYTDEMKEKFGLGTYVIEESDKTEDLLLIRVIPKNRFVEQKCRYLNKEEKRSFKNGTWGKDNTPKVYRASGSTS